MCNAENSPGRGMRKAGLVLAVVALATITCRSTGAFTPTPEANPTPIPTAVLQHTNVIEETVPIAEVLGIGEFAGAGLLNIGGNQEIWQMLGFEIQTIEASPDGYNMPLFIPDDQSRSINDMLSISEDGQQVAMPVFIPEDADPDEVTLLIAGTESTMALPRTVEPWGRAIAPDGTGYKVFTAAELLEALKAVPNVTIATSLVQWSSMGGYDDMFHGEAVIPFRVRVGDFVMQTEVEMYRVQLAMMTPADIDEILSQPRVWEIVDASDQAVESIDREIEADSLGPTLEPAEELECVDHLPQPPANPDELNDYLRLYKGRWSGVDNARIYSDAMRRYLIEVLGYASNDHTVTLTCHAIEHPGYWNSKSETACGG